MIWQIHTNRLLIVKSLLIISHWEIKLYQKYTFKYLIVLFGIDIDLSFPIAHSVGNKCPNAWQYMPTVWALG